jgi:hypothetical protein
LSGLQEAEHWASDLCRFFVEIVAEDAIKPRPSKTQLQMDREVRKT